MRIHPRTIPELDAALKSTKTAVKLLEESLREARAAVLAVVILFHGACATRKENK